MTNMERKEQIPVAGQDTTEIFVKIDGQVENVSPESFFKVTKGMFEVMKEVDHAMSNGQASVQWEVTDLVKGSGAIMYGIVSIQPGSSRAQNFRNTFLGGMRAIQERASQRPANFTDKALRKIRGIISTLPEKENLVSIGSQGAPLFLTMESVAQIDEWMESKYVAVGSIEGVLKNVSSHDKYLCAIYDKFERKIDCYFPEHLKTEVKLGLYERVAIRGLISYRVDGTPVSVKPTAIKLLRAQSELPPIRDLMGSWKMDMSSEEYVRSLYDE